MYIIVFRDGDMTNAYAGSTYICKGERCASLDNDNPKLYKTEGLAERSAKRLIANCTNVTAKYEIIEK